MTPEQAAEKAAAILDQAAAWANDPETTAGLVNVADGWTRLHTALKMGQTELMVAPVEATISEGEVVIVYGRRFEITGWDFDTVEDGKILKLHIRKVV